ncbi:hypothetical protein [Cronobacter sakazakii]|uniref:hypothetical protein n=1 Tax=Cronobacter sakazakii TaxID=28141 RepID=UPI001319E5DF|nr:hypothetical protein [Cronobacter sakazakii]EKA5402665.1 hypothetical protein [Cronobacter sakazakii]EKC6207729.1 hypothetical protein [Cronobacter sakazakii]EKD3162752.1 hypothetical protein [Cronobacter sakazakii]EKD3181240.1 hypothetical protein [Cronobacter sakazakii]EKD3190687.1 hypothetical protein [Cronobacter sakazakii]
MEKHVYNGVEYEIEIIDGIPVAVYLNGKRVDKPLSDEILKDFAKKRLAPPITPRRPKP